MKKVVILSLFLSLIFAFRVTAQLPDHFAKNYPFIPSDLIDCAYKKEVGVVEEVKGKGTYVTYKGNIKYRVYNGCFGFTIYFGGWSPDFKKIVPHYIGEFKKRSQTKGVVFYDTGGIFSNHKGKILIYNIGEFSDGELNGQGISFTRTSGVREGVWENGKFKFSKSTPYRKYVNKETFSFFQKSNKSTKPNILRKAFKELENDARKSIQAILKIEGFYNSTIDGLYGRGTEKALREYNKKYLSNSDLKKKDNVSALLAKLEEQKAPTPKVETKKEVVTTSTDTKKINTEWQLLAEEGSAMAQYKLASMYEQGEGLLKDFVYAHMWANLSATNGYAEAKDLRDALEKKMTASQMEKAQDLARECMRKKYKGC